MSEALLVGVIVSAVNLVTHFMSVRKMDRIVKAHAEESRAETARILREHGVFVPEPKPGYLP